MIKDTSSRDINPFLTENQGKGLIANITTLDNTILGRCPKCNSLVIIIGDNLLDLNRKRHFCDETNRTLHERESVDYLQKMVDHYNQYELSSFQLGLTMDE